MKQSHSVVDRLRAAGRLLLTELRLAARRRHAVKDLKRLSARELADIGISRHAIREVVDQMLASPRPAAPLTVADAPGRPGELAEAVKDWQKAA